MGFGLAVFASVRAWANTLQNSDIRGPRYLTDASRRAYQQNRERAELSERLKKDHEELLRRLAAEREARKTEERGEVRSEI